jgi:glutamate-ammonia-ligase adenylyltransferase
MTRSLEQHLGDALAGTVLADRLRTNGAAFLELRADDLAARNLKNGALIGLARLLATQPEVAGFLSHRPHLFERIAQESPGSLARRQRELQDDRIRGDAADLESALDGLRILRREETCLAACHDLGGLASFEEVSDFLSVLAETIAQRALDLAEASAAAEQTLSVIGMGKIAGREFTYHSDLDLIFLYEGGPDAIAQASRAGQRLIAYLTTMTGAGVAYAVDTRLRPSGQQGMLVTSLDAFERYQCENAQTWEHLALLRARAIAGNREVAQRLLDHVRARVLSRGVAPWKDLAPLRQRVEQERAPSWEGVIPLKTGAGGLMDVDFLAGGAVLERGVRAFPTLPSVTAMLRAVVQGQRVDQLLADYHLLRVTEARARWVAGRAVEDLRTADGELAVIAELVEPGLASEELLARIDAARRRNREGYAAVIAARSIDALMK